MDTAVAKSNDNNYRSISKRANFRDRESIEQMRLQQRVGNYHVYVDSNEIFHPDPASTHFVSEAERFDKDFNVAEGIKRSDAFNNKQNQINKLKEERMKRDITRYDFMNKERNLSKRRVEIKRDVYKAGVKNQGGAAFNIVTLDYDQTKDG